MSISTNHKNVFLESQISKSIETLLKLAGTTLGFGTISIHTYSLFLSNINSISLTTYQLFIKILSSYGQLLTINLSAFMCMLNLMY